MNKEYIYIYIQGKVIVKDENGIQTPFATLIDFEMYRDYKKSIKKEKGINNQLEFKKTACYRKRKLR